MKHQDLARNIRLFHAPEPPSGPILGSSWLLPGLSWAHLGPILAPLGFILAPCWPHLGPLGRSWCPLGLFLALLALLAALGPILALGSLGSLGPHVGQLERLPESWLSASSSSGTNLQGITLFCFLASLLHNSVISYETLTKKS